jgi:hypothetical protein
MDAFCPECRHDLSMTPEEAQEAAENTFRAVMGVAKFATGNDGEETPEKARAKSFGYSLRFTGATGFGLTLAVSNREWVGVLVAAFLLVACLFWVRGEYRQSAVTTTVTGRGKTTKDSDQTQ